VRVPAITVQPLNVLRLAQGSYIKAGRAAGLDLDPKRNQAGLEDGLPPGFSD
jgi:hypothetical protein